MKRKMIVGMLLALWCFLSGASMAKEPKPPGRNLNPGVLSPHAMAFGQSYGVWAGDFNNWVWQFPLAESPFFAVDGSNCGQGQQGKVWFLAGVFGGDITREGCEIPAGKAIFVSIASVVSFIDPLFGENEEEVRADAKSDLASVDKTTLIAFLDGNPINNLSDYYAESPEGGFVLSIPDDSILNDFGFEGDRDPAVAVGYWLMLAPLEPGEHVLRWSLPGSYDVTYHFTVVGDDG